MRNRFFTQYAGVETAILTFDVQPVYPLERQRLVDRGELIPGMRLLNIFEFYRDEQLDGDPSADALPDLGGLTATDVGHPDGTVYYTAYQEPETEVDLVRDYRRKDGSVYVRTPGPEVRAHPVPYVLADRNSRPLHTWPSIRGWGHHWLLTLLGEQSRAFVISDARHALQPLLPLPDERFYVMQLVHNVHTEHDRRWNAGVLASYQPMLNGLSELDGLVLLSRRQRADVKQLFGARNNIFSVPNPVTLPERPQPLPKRDSARFSIVSRFTGQKRLDRAVRAFALVVEDRPGAVLHIYGNGETRRSVEALISELGMQNNIELRGWDPDARDTLWTSTAFLMSSAFEGYPLATLESLSRGCPVISYDIKYGPSEQVTDRIDGFLVGNGDQRAMADRIIQMIDDPDLVRRLSAAAFEKAAQHDYKAFMQDWLYVLTKVESNRPRRVALKKVMCNVSALGFVPSPLPSRFAARVLSLRWGSAAVASSRRIVFEADLVVRGSWPRGALRHARVTLDAVSDKTETVTRLPLVVEREGRRFSVRSKFPLQQVFRDREPDDGVVTLRLRLVLRNDSWETVVARPPSADPQFEVSYDAQRRLHLRRAAPDPENLSPDPTLKRGVGSRTTR